MENGATSAICSIHNTCVLWKRFSNSLGVIFSGIDSKHHNEAFIVLMDQVMQKYIYYFY